MSKNTMVRVHPSGSLSEVIEVPATSLARAIDWRCYYETRAVKYVDSPRLDKELPIDHFRPFDWVEMETGFEEMPGTKSVVIVAEKMYATV